MLTPPQFVEIVFSIVVKYEPHSVYFEV